jgi:hypothetical protein
MNYLQLVDYESWIYKQGPDPTDTLAILWNNNNEVQAAIALMNGYIACAGACSPAGYQSYNAWPSNQRVIFLQTCLSTFQCNNAVQTRIDNDLDITGDTDPEVLQRWFTIALYNSYSPAYTPIQNWVSSQGRTKYMQPIFDACSEMGGSIYTMCVGWYNQNKYWWVPITKVLVQTLLFLPNGMAPTGIITQRV